MKNIYKDKLYWHFDGHRNIKKLKRYIEDDQYVLKHGFFPFLHYTKSFDKFNITRAKGERRKPKNREIYYCSHIDRYIYQRCGNEISQYYNDYCIENGFNECSIAYRNNNPGKCNIHFAKDVFKFIKKSKECFIIVGDFHKFFDNLDHQYLYRMLLKCMDQERLSDVQYKIFKNICKFAYINIEDLCLYMDIKRRNVSKLKDRLTTKELRELKDEYLQKNIDKKTKQWNDFGIPQGSPISAIYANVYMIEFDKKLCEFVNQYKGLYRRYSDDFIIVLPKVKDSIEQRLVANQLFKFVSETKNLHLETTKTSCYYFKEKDLLCIEDLLPNQKNESKTLNYLGFTFDGKHIRLRDKTITKYYYKLYKAIDKHLKLERKKGVRLNRHHLIKRKSVYGIKKGKRNFLTYVNRALKEFPNEELIKKVKKSNLNKISARFNLKKTTKKTQQD